MVDELDSEILAGVPFIARNDIIPRCKNNEIIFGDNGEVIKYACKTKSKDAPSIRRTSVVRANQSVTVWPGDYVELQLSPNKDAADHDIALEPCIDNNNHWVSPSMLRSVGNTVRIHNSSDLPQIIKKNDHVCQVSNIYTPSPPETGLFLLPNQQKLT